MSKVKSITPEFMAKLRKIKEYLDGEKIGSAIVGNEVVYELGGRNYRTRSLFETKRNIDRYCETSTM